MGSMLLLGIKNEILILKQLGIRIPFLRLLNTFSIFPNYLLTMQKIQIKPKKKDYHFNLFPFSIGKYISLNSQVSRRLSLWEGPKPRRLFSRHSSHSQLNKEINIKNKKQSISSTCIQ